MPSIYIINPANDVVSYHCGGSLMRPATAVAGR